MKFNKNFKSWVNNLLDEGYDLSDYSLHEMYELYLSEGNPGVSLYSKNNRPTIPVWLKGQDSSKYKGGFRGVPFSSSSRPSASSSRPPGDSSTRVNNSSNVRPQAYLGFNFAQRAQKATNPMERTFNQRMSQYASVVNTKNLAGQKQNVTAGRPYDAKLNGKSVNVTYDLQGKRTITPKEEFEYWVDSLHEDGYDLSNYTWEGLFEYYLNEVAESFNTEKWNLGKGSRSNGKGSPYTQEILRQKDLETSTNSAPTPAPSPTSTKPAPVVWSKPEKDDYIKKGLDIYGTQRSVAMKKLGAAKTPEAQSSAQSAMNTARDTGLAVWRARYSDTYANKPSTSSAGTSSQMQDIQKMRAASAMRQGGVSLPGANNPTSVDITNSQNRQRTAPSSPAPTSSTAPTTPAKPTKDFNRATGSSKPGSRLESYDFASPNQVALDMQHLYQSIYEGKKVDQDQDGDNDGADVMIARMIASGMSREEAIRRTRKKSYNKESYDLEQLAILYLVQEGYAEDLRSAQAIYENASLEFKKNLQEIAPALVAGAARVASVTRAAAPVMSKLAKSKNLRNVASNLLSKQEQSTPSTGENASKENPTLDKIRDLLKTVRGEE